MNEDNSTPTTPAAPAGVVVAPAAPQALGFTVNGLVDQAGKKYWRVDDLDAGNTGLAFLQRPAALVADDAGGRAAADVVCGALNDLRNPPAAISDQEARGLAAEEPPAAGSKFGDMTIGQCLARLESGRKSADFTPDELRLLAMAVWLRVDRLNAAADEARGGKLDLAPDLAGVAEKLFAGQASAMLGLLAKLESFGAA